MYKPCPYCTKKKPHYHKGCHELTLQRQLISPIKKKKKDDIKI